MTGRLGALTERSFRLVFTSTTISALGDGVASIALVFAILKISHDSPTAVGLVIAARQVAAAAITLAAGVWADRLPRHLVLVTVAAIQAVVQGAAGVLLVSGHATVAILAGLAVIYGLADGFVLPASQGLIPAVVSSSRLQQANALLGLSRSLLGFLAPAIGGALVALGSPGAAILVDAATFGVAAILLLRLVVPARADTVQPERFLRELAQGWGELRRQEWIWKTIVFFGIGNFAGQSWPVLAPLVTKQHYAGPSTFAAILSAFGVGAVIGGLVVLRIRPKRPLLVSCLAAAPLASGQIALAFLLPVPVLLAASVLSGLGLAIHLALWFTVFQQQVPEASRARVSSYDALGSFVLIPLGSAVAGPLAASIGIKATLLGSAAVEILCILIVVLQPSIWAITREPAPA